MEMPGVHLIDQNSGEMYPLGSVDTMIIGRGFPKKVEAEKLSLPHPLLSKTHVRIFIDPETQRWQLEDMSKNGCWINKKRVLGKIALVHGDHIRMASYQFIFYENFGVDEGTMEINSMGRPFPADEREEMSIAEKITLTLMLGLVAIFLLLWLGKFL